jgi:hypothetical protein
VNGVKSTKTVPWGRGPNSLEPCGTDAAYRRHLRRKEEPCEPCRAANTVGTRATSAATRERADRIRSSTPRLPASAGRDEQPWWLTAACQDTAPLFDLIGATPTATHWQAAHDYCARCPVIQQCADSADRRGEPGLWGGSYRTGTAHGFHKLIKGAPERRIP